VQVVNINNGEQQETHAIRGEQNTGMIYLNGQPQEKHRQAMWISLFLVPHWILKKKKI
jgi:aspartate 1-decarboxylase